MATALQIITRSMRLAGTIGKNEILDDDEAQNGLTALNSMLDSWKIERLFVYQIVQGSYTWPAATTSRTIGSSGNFDTTRPDRIQSAFFVDSNSTWYEVQVLSMREEYDIITVKTTQSTVPAYLFYDPAYPLGVIYLWCVPSAQGTLKLNTWQALQSFSALTTDLALPPGYERAIVYGLAVEYAPEFGVKVPDDVKALAMRAISNVKNLNAPQMISQVDAGIVRAGGLNWPGRYNIYADR